MVREQAGTYDTDDELRAKAQWVRCLAMSVSDREMVTSLGRYADELEAGAVTIGRMPGLQIEQQASNPLRSVAARSPRSET
jgi:hypothetical protein